MSLDLISPGGVEMHMRWVDSTEHYARFSDGEIEVKITPVSGGRESELLSAPYPLQGRSLNTVKLAGASYLVWLGLQTLWGTHKRARIGPIQEPRIKSQRPRLAKAQLTQGVLTSVLNPKLAVFFLSFLPQYVDGTVPATPQILVLATTFIAMGATWLFVYVWLVDHLSTVLTRPVVRRWSDRFVGTTLVALGIRLAVIETK